MRVPKAVLRKQQNPEHGQWHVTILMLLQQTIIKQSLKQNNITAFVFYKQLHVAKLV